MDEQAQREHRNRSELLREAIRLYLEEQRRKNIEEQRLKRLLQGLEESAGSWKDDQLLDVAASLDELVSSLRHPPAYRARQAAT